MYKRIKQGLSEHDGRSVVYDHLELQVIYNYCHTNCCCNNCGHFTCIYLNLPDFYSNQPEFTGPYLNSPEFTGIFLNFSDYT